MMMSSSFILQLNPLPLWQPVGWSTNHLTKTLSDSWQTKIAHTGTLDPLAQGVVILLPGELRYKKPDYSKWPKSYDFNIIFGLETDTLDGMGYLEKLDLSLKTTQNNITATRLLACLKTFVGNYLQVIPYYSAKKVNHAYGCKPLHWYARNVPGFRATVPAPKLEGHIHALELLALTSSSLTNFVSELIPVITSIRGDFRQTELISRWQDHLLQHADYLITVAQVRVTTSGGVYVRGLARDISARLGTVGIADQIIRTSNGGYKKSDAFNLSDVFVARFLATPDTSASHHPQL